MRKFAPFLLLLFCVSACGFTPLYGTHSDNKIIAPKLTQIAVSTIADAQGQQLRNLLLDRLPPPAPSQRYQLNVNLIENKVGVAISRDATVTREQLRSTVRANLYDRSLNKTVWTQDVFTTSGYNVLGSQFSNLVGEADARTRNLNDLSERLVNMLALYFERGENANERGENISAPPPVSPPSPISNLTSQQ